MPASLHFVIEFPKLSTIIQYRINCKMNVNKTNRLAIARAHFFGIACFIILHSYKLDSTYSVPSKIFILYYFQIDLTDGACGSVVVKALHY